MIDRPSSRPSGSAILARATAAAALLAAVLLPMGDAAPAQSVTEAGRLTCRVAPSIGALIGSRRRLSCKYVSNSRNQVESYSGTVTRFGLDVGITAGGIMSWAVLARTKGARRGALAGHYVGVSGDVSLGPGIGAKALIGGSRRSTVLQPVSVMGKVGANLALGVTGLTLRFEDR
ncbi:MAG TPA: DUF992 domain-containing protein [Xanthobacteraceae bacterium]|jgi:hypothetical protein